MEWRIEGRWHSQVEEKLGNDVECKEAVGAQLAVGETDNAEEDGEHDEAHQLNGLPSDGVHGSHGYPIPRNGSSTDNDDVTDSAAIEDVVGRLGTSGRVANGGENDSVVETETIESDIEEEPRTCRAEQDLAIPPLRVVTDEVGPRGLGNLHRAGILLGLNASQCVRMTLSDTTDVSLDVLVGFFRIASHIEGVSRRFGNGEAVVEGDTGLAPHQNR